MNPSALAQLPPAVASRVLKSLSYREREVLKLLTGLTDGYRYTNEEVAQIFKVSPDTLKKIVWVAMQRAERVIHSQVPEGDHSSSDVVRINVTVAIPNYCEDAAVAGKLVELLIALNDMHLGAGGSGLIISDDQTFAAAGALEGLPVR